MPRAIIWIFIMMRGPNHEANMVCRLWGYSCMGQQRWWFCVVGSVCGLPKEKGKRGGSTMKLLTAQFDMMVPLYMDYDRVIKDKTVDMALLDKFPDIPIMLVEIEIVPVVWDDDEGAQP